MKGVGRSGQLAEPTFERRRRFNLQLFKEQCKLKMEKRIFFVCFSSFQWNWFEMSTINGKSTISETKDVVIFKVVVFWKLSPQSIVCEIVFLRNHSIQYMHINIHCVSVFIISIFRWPVLFFRKILCIWLETSTVH